MNDSRPFRPPTELFTSTIVAKKAHTHTPRLLYVNTNVIGKD